MKPFDIIYARDTNYGIGIKRDNVYDLPWTFNVDMKYFNTITSTTDNGLPTNDYMNAVIMGRNTWYSIDEKYRPLPNRTNIIISSTIDTTEVKHLKNTYLAKNLEEAMRIVNNDYKINKIFVIGGSILYNEAYKMNNFRYLYETIIMDNFNCDIKVNNYPEIYTYKKKMFLLKNMRDNKKYNVEFKQSINVNYCKTNNVKIIDMIPKCYNIEEQQYLNILENLIRDGEFRKTRNANTWSLFNTSTTYDLEKGFPLLTSKKVNFKGVFEELLWFLKGDTNAKHLDDVGVKIWNPNSTREFLDNNGLKHYQPYDIGPMYGYNWLHYGHPYSGKDVDYTGKGFNQIEYILNLIKNDPTSRRIVMSTFNPGQANEGVLYPCHGLITQFYVSNGKLDIVTYQRSVDIFCGFPFNIASYALLNHLICNTVNNDPNYQGNKISPGKLTIHLGDYHLYEDHYDQAILQILREPFDFPKLLIKNNKTILSEFSFDDLKLENQKTYGTILAKMVA